MSYLNQPELVSCDLQPADWVDEEFIDDPEDKKPDVLLS